MRRGRDERVGVKAKLLLLAAVAAPACSKGVTGDGSSEGDALASQSQALTLDALQAYAQECDQATGTTVPDFVCDDPAATEPPVTHPVTDSSGNVTACDRPNRLNQECDPGSKFHVLTNTAAAFVVAHCRKRKNAAGFFGDIAVIQHNKLTGATCWYQALGTLNGNVKAPSRGQSAWSWDSPSQTAGISCAGCHDNGPLIRSPYLTQITGANQLPGAGDTTFNRDQPYFHVGKDFASWKTFKVETSNGLCSNCHRMGANSLNASSGTSADFGIRATATSETSKNPHSTNSPIWMTPGQVVYSASNATAAQTYRNCAARSTERPLPDDPSCRITFNTRRGLTAASANPAGYRRFDGYNAVVQRGSNNHILEFSLESGAWYLNDLFTAIGAPVASASADPAAYVRSDQTSAVVYRGSDNHVYELALGPSGWLVSDLSGGFGGPNAAGNPAGYTRSDGVNAVVYRASTGHIYEIASVPGGWGVNDLTVVTGATVNAAGDPVPFVRADRTNSVLYRGTNSHVIEFSLDDTGWGAGDLTAQVGSGNVAGNPAGYVRADGLSAVVVRGSNNHVFEYSLDATGWFWGDLTGASNLAAGDPVPYVRSDVINAVVYRDSSGHVHELSLDLAGGGWFHADMTQLFGLPTASADPFGYVRSDMLSAVLFRTSDNHVHELGLSPSGWAHGDITAVAIQ